MPQKTQQTMLASPYLHMRLSWCLQNRSPWTRLVRATPSPLARNTRHKTNKVQPEDTPLRWYSQHPSM